MRFRLGCLLGFASGYYLGARAGRARYDQLNRLLAKARRSDAYETASDKAKDLVDEGVERARDLVDDGVERARDFVEEHRSTDDDSDGIPIGTVVGAEAGSAVPDPDVTDLAGTDPTVADLSPGPPPAGSLSDEPRPGGPAAP